MINQVYRLVSPRQFEVTYIENSINKEEIVIRPTHLSICAADQRYYTGIRGEEAMKKKLPMALIHEGIGEVVYDPTGTIAVGTKVVMIPNNPTEEDPYVAENYLQTSQFASSGYDGFMQDYIFLNKNRIVVLPEEMNLNVAAFTELVTIAVHAITRFEQKSIQRREFFGVWGDGNLGYITSLLLKKLYPRCKVFLFGKTAYKMSHFTFVDETYNITAIPSEIQVDHAFECVGGHGSGLAINQMIDYVKPEGTLNILGVSEFPVEINTRMILEKGITMIGSSRSGKKDFEATLRIYQEMPEMIEYLSVLIDSIVEITKLEHIIQAFEQDLKGSWGKTIIEWKI